MTLFLNLNGVREGYDFCVNRTSPSNGQTSVESIDEEGVTPCGTARIRYEENRLMLQMPKSALGMKTGAAVTFTFKWADNYEDGNLMSFYTRGDSAPYGRLNWVYGGVG